jgi:hypothetical protein
MFVHRILLGRRQLQALGDIGGSRAEVGDNVLVERHPGVTAAAIPISRTLDVEPVLQAVGKPVNYK